MGVIVFGIKKACLSLTCITPAKDTCLRLTTSNTLPSFLPVPCLILVIFTLTSSPFKAVLKSVGKTKISFSILGTITKPIPDFAISNTPW